MRTISCRCCRSLFTGSGILTRKSAIQMLLYGTAADGMRQSRPEQARGRNLRSWWRTLETCDAGPRPRPAPREEAVAHPGAAPRRLLEICGAGAPARIPRGSEALVGYSCNLLCARF